MSARDDLLEDLERVCAELWMSENHALFPFGSHVTGLARPDSDLDLVIVFPDWEVDQIGSTVRDTLVIPRLRQLRNRLERRGFQVTNFIINARVPIVSFQCPKRWLSCDVSLQQPLFFYLESC